MNFDGKLLHVRKGCAYYYYVTPDVTVTGGAGSCYPDGNCSMAAEIAVGENRIAITKDTVKLNGVVIPLFTVNHNISNCTIRNGMKLIVDCLHSHRVTVMSDKGKTFFALLLSSFRKKTH